MRNAGLDEAQARIKIAGRNINNLRYADDTILKAESKANNLLDLEICFVISESGCHQQGCDGNNDENN